MRRHLAGAALRVLTGLIAGLMVHVWGAPRWATVGFAVVAYISAGAKQAAE